MALCPSRPAEQDFNSLDAQREASEAFIVSQKREGWALHAVLRYQGVPVSARKDRHWRGCVGVAGLRAVEFSPGGLFGPLSLWPP